MTESRQNRLRHQAEPSVRSDAIGSGTAPPCRRQPPKTWLFASLLLAAAPLSCNLLTDSGPTLSVVIEEVENATGTVVSQPPGINCGAVCSESFAFRTDVLLSAVPAAGAMFLDWQGACTGSARTCSVSMTADRSVRARFGPGYAIRVTKLGSGTGTVMSNPGEILCGNQCEGSFPKGTSVTLTAEAGEASLFMGWSGSCSGTNRRCTLEVDQAHEAIATFVIGQVLDIALTGTGSGKVESVPFGIDCGLYCKAIYPDGEVVSLTATTAEGSTFTGWSGDCQGTGSTCVLNMTQNRAASAEFAQTHTLTLNQPGNDIGHIMSSPAGVNCYGPCTVDVPHGTTLMLVAQGVGGSNFAGWSGECAGWNEACTLNVTGDLTVNAYFVSHGHGIWAQVTADSANSCATTVMGQTYCWGSGQEGQLGVGNTANQLTPAQVFGAYEWVKVAAGGFHSCGITSSGDAYCWGRRQFGQLGDGNVSTVPQLTPVLVEGGHSWVWIAAGLNHTCGITVDGDAYCWGLGNNGRLGDGTTSTSSEPSLVAGQLRWREVVPGFQHTCGVTVDDDAYCWGNGSYGRLGTGTTTTRTSPWPVSGGRKWLEVAAGREHSCGVTLLGEAFCWGRSNYGQLGNGTTTSRTSPFAVAGALTWTNIGAGDYHSCGVTAIGEAYCWGVGVAGRLGNGDENEAHQFTPARVAGDQVWGRILPGAAHTCGRTAGNATYCWGSGLSGEMGNGQTPIAQVLPVRVINP